MSGGDNPVGAEAALPKVIWFLWFQGQEEMPCTVRHCLDSWRLRNPGWKLVFLEKDNLADYLPERIAREVPASLTLQAYSDVIRINLLREYGGVWVDATCFCVRPLDNWIESYMAEGFFAFRNPGGNRLLSSWFLAAAQNNYLASTYQGAVSAYMDFGRVETRIPMSLKAEEFIRRLLGRFGLQNSQLVSPLFARVSGRYPYFWFHYLFQFLCLQNQEFNRKWEQVPGYSADIPHGIQVHGLYKSVSDQLKQEIDQRQAPLYKLNWDVDYGRLGEESALSYLLGSLSEER